jgi:hypothetical protein
VTIDSTAHVVSTHEVDLVLYVKVDNADNTIRTPQAINRVNDGVELGYHAQGIAHGDKFSTTSICVLVEVADSLTLRYYFLALVGLRFVFMKAKCTRILADDLDVCPAEAGKAFPGHLTQ